VFEQSDWLLHVAAPDLAALRSTQASLAVFSRLPELACEHRLALNGIHARARIDRAAVEQTLGRRFDLVVPHGEAVLESLDHGVPVALSAPADPVVQALDGWVRQVSDVQAPTAARASRSFWPRFKPAAAARLPLPVFAPRIAERKIRRLLYSPRHGAQGPRGRRGWCSLPTRRAVAAAS
jgi:Flp pilus assembly CpaE family ATPase